MAKWARVHERKKVGGKKQVTKGPESKIELEEPTIERESKGTTGKLLSTAKGKGTRYSNLYSTVRKKAGTTYSPKYSPKH